MEISEKFLSLISEFVDEKNMKAVANFMTGDDFENSDVDSIANMFGYSGAFSQFFTDDKCHLIQSFAKNLNLLIQKTWVDKNDAFLKDEILYKLDKLFTEPLVWKDIYGKFLEIISKAVSLMFGEQSKDHDFDEYCLRIDPEFGIFWWYVRSLPKNATWNEEKYHTAVLLGMYFLANY